jgi:hypothetical protein
VYTAPKMKPGTPDPTPTGQSIFEDALHSLQEDLAIELAKDVRGCERSTKTAVDAAQPAQKLSAFHTGFDGWCDKLCASTTKYHNELFKIVLANRLQHDHFLFRAKMSSTDTLANPAGFAKELTEAESSSFLGVTAFDRKEPAREIGSNGRVRWFVRHVNGDLSDLYPSAYAEQNRLFLLPLWFQHEWNIKASMAKLAWRPPGSAPFTPPIDESSFFSAEETEKFILGLEESLIGKLRANIAAAHRKASISLGEIGTATAPPSAGVSAIASETPGTAEGLTPTERKHRECVAIYRRVYRELVTVKARLELPEDYQSIRSEYPGFTVFRVCQQHSDLRERVRAMKQTPKQKHNTLAFQIAARHCGCAVDSLRTWWKKSPAGERRL